MKPTTAALIIPNLSSKPLEFVTLELDQCFHDHHRANIVIDMQHIGENVFASPMKKTSLVNEKVIVYIREGEDEVNAYTFSGIITDVRVEPDKGDHGLLHVYAASPTIQLERGRMMQTFSDTDLEQIAGEVTAGVRFSVVKKPKYGTDIKFSMQYRERAIRVFKIKDKVSGFFKTRHDTQCFAQLHSLADTARKNNQFPLGVFWAATQIR
jgi:hypothetical protein